MAKLSDNKTLEKCRNLQMLTIIFVSFLIIPTVFPQKIDETKNVELSSETLTSKQQDVIDKKIKDFDKLTEEEKIKEMYSEVIETREKIVVPSIDVKGTEYKENNLATVFLQLLDEDKQPISNSTCFVSIWYPNKAMWVNNSLMSNLGTDGLYYYDTTVPSNLGVYMVSAYCYIPELVINETIMSYDGFESGGFSGGTGWANSSWGVSGDGSIQSDNPIGSYEVRFRNAGVYMDRYFNITSDEYIGFDDVKVNFYIRTTGWENSDYADVNIYDAYTTYHVIRQFYNGEDDNVYRQYSFNLKEAQYENVSGIGFHLNGNANNDQMYIDEISLVGYDYILVNITEYQIVRGSGEIHVSHSEVNYTYFDDKFSNISVVAEINQTYFDVNFNQTWFNQQTTYSFLQAMNTTMVTNQNYIISLVNNVSIKIDDTWQEFWDTARARIIS